MKEYIIFCTDSTEIFFSKLRSAGLNYNLPSFSLTLTVRGVSNKHCLLTFFILDSIEKKSRKKLSKVLNTFENIMENGAFALMEQMLDSPQYF